MATPVHTPRINNNDDHVKLIALEVAVGEQIERGKVLGQVETDKAVVEIEAPATGVLTAIDRPVGDTVAMGARIGGVTPAGKGG